MKAKCRSGAGIVLAGLIALQAAPIVATPARAQTYDTMSCEELWFSRNAIYAAQGFCFKTPRAKAVFGSGCFPPFGKLTPAEEDEVAVIKQWEGYRGCEVAAGPPPSVPQPPAPPPPADYGEMSCDQLWFARNVIYAAKGYCFKSKRALSVFGTRCFPPYGKLTGAEQDQVGIIEQWERSKGCH